MLEEDRTTVYKRCMYSWPSSVMDGGGGTSTAGPLGTRSSKMQKTSLLGSIAGTATVMGRRGLAAEGVEMVEGGTGVLSAAAGDPCGASKSGHAGDVRSATTGVVSLSRYPPPLVRSVCSVACSRCL